MAAPTIRVAVTQAEPKWLDLQGTVKKTIDLIGEAAQSGAKTIAFPEVWITEYPAWIWSRPVDMALVTQYALNSLAVESPKIERIKTAPKNNDIYIVLGFSERTQTNSVYISQAIIDPQGSLVIKRRKIEPSHVERTLFGDATSTNLTNVAPILFDPPIGTLNIGTLACWEHAQPLLKYHTYSQAESIHIAMWPPIDPFPSPSSPTHYGMSADGCLRLSQVYALEGACYVLHCTAVCGQKGIDKLGLEGTLLCNGPGGGHSCVLGPDGRVLTEELGAEVEGIVYCDLEVGGTVGASAILDCVGQYSRPDLLWFGVDRGEKRCVVYKDGE